MSVPPKACEIEGCPLLADYAIYPDHRRKVEVATYLCAPHREDAAKTGNNLYIAANKLIRQSLV